jgi:hypothetical protein
MSGDAEKNNYELMNIQNLWLKIRKIMSWLAYSVPILISRAWPIMSGDTEKELGVGKNSECELKIWEIIWWAAYSLVLYRENAGLCLVMLKKIIRNS